MMTGMVVIGYQDIGKTCSAGWCGCVDLESSCFYIGGMRQAYWHVAYCNVAQCLAEQGYTVFVSSHKAVRDELAKRTALRVVVVAPVPELWREWIMRLTDRYLRTSSGKDYRALVNALDRYEDNVRELLGDERFETYPIEDMDYELLDIVRTVRDKGVSEHLAGTEMG